MSVNRFSTGLRKMSPGTIGGQSRVATPVHRRAPFNVQTLRPEDCGVAITYATVIGSSSAEVPLPDGRDGDLLRLFATVTTTIPTPSGWTLVSGLSGQGSVYQRRVYTKTRAGGETSLTLPFGGSGNDATIILINIPLGDPPPKANGVIATTDNAHGSGFNGDFQESIALFTELDNPGTTVMIPWFETASECDAFISETSDPTTIIEPYFKVRVPLPSTSPNLNNQIIVAVRNEPGTTQHWGNFVVPGLAVTRAVAYLRVQEMICS